MEEYEFYSTSRRHTLAVGHWAGLSGDLEKQMSVYRVKCAKTGLCKLSSQQDTCRILAFGCTCRQAIAKRDLFERYN